MNIGENEKQIQSVAIEILQDCVAEDKRIIKRLQLMIVLLIVSLFGSFVLLFGSFIYYTYELTQFDFEGITTTATNDNETFSENSPINANIHDINVNSKE